MSTARCGGLVFERVGGKNLCYTLSDDGREPGAVTARVYLHLVCWSDNLFNGSDCPRCDRQIAEALNTKERAVRRGLEALYDAGLVERVALQSRLFYRICR